MSKRKATTKTSKSKESPAKKVKESKDTEEAHHHESNPWTDLIRSVTLKELCKHKPNLIVISDNARLEDAMHVLSKNNILSLPVVSEEKKQFYGFVDVLDIAGFVLARWKKVSIGLNQTHFPTTALFDANILDVLNFSNVNYPVYLSEDATVDDAIRLFCDPKSYFRLHRIAVQNAKGKVVNVLSQSDIIAFAYEHKDKLPASMIDLKVGNITGLVRAPIMVRIDSPFSEALETLFKNRISGLAMIDHEFKLCGNLSASDLRGMNSLAFDFFDGSVLQFLIKGTTSKPKRPSSVTTETNFGEVLKLFHEEKVHRLYMVDSSGHPIGFISLIDVIARL